MDWRCDRVRVFPCGSGASGYVTPRAMSTGQEPYIQLRCSLPAQNAEFNNKASPPQTGYTDVLANIPILVAPFSQIIYQPFTPEMFSWTMPSKGMKLGTIEFYMTDHNGASITMVDDFDFSLRVDILRDVIRVNAHWRRAWWRRRWGKRRVGWRRRWRRARRLRRRW